MLLDEPQIMRSPLLGWWIVGVGSILIGDLPSWGPSTSHHISSGRGGFSVD